MPRQPSSDLRSAISSATGFCPGFKCFRPAPRMFFKMAARLPRTNNLTTPFLAEGIHSTMLPAVNPTASEMASGTSS